MTKDTLRARAEQIAAALQSCLYIGTAGDLILEIESVFFRVDVRDTSVGVLGAQRIGAVHRYVTRQREALAALESLLTEAEQERERLKAEAFDKHNAMMEALTRAERAEADAKALRKALARALEIVHPDY